MEGELDRKARAKVQQVGIGNNVRQEREEAYRCGEAKGRVPGDQNRYSNLLQGCGGRDEEAGVDGGDLTMIGSVEYINILIT